MSKRSIMLLIGTGLLLVGIIIGVWGFALGGATNSVYIDGQGVHVKKERGSEVMDAGLKEFRNIDIKTSSMRVELIETTDKNAIEYKLDGAEKLIECDVVNDTLVFKTKFSISIMMFSIQESYVKIYYTAGSEFDSVSVRNGSGSINASGIKANSLYVNSSSGSRKLDNITAQSITVEGASGSLDIMNTSCNDMSIHSTSGNIEVSGLTCETAQIKNVSGSIKLSRLDGKSVTAQNASGSIKMSDIDCDRIEAKNTSGRLELDDIESNETKLNSVSGSIKASGELSGNTTIHNVSGSITVKNSLSKDSFGYRLSSSSGSTKVDEETFKGSVNQGNVNFIDASTASGNIKLYFGI